MSDPVPFDLFCPRTKGTLSVRLCKIYFATQAALKRHKQEKVCGVLPPQDSEPSRRIPNASEVETGIILATDTNEYRAVATRNIFDIFRYQFEDSLNF